jgi:predicted metal-binding membrane protein
MPPHREAIAGQVDEVIAGQVDEVIAGQVDEVIAGRRLSSTGPPADPQPHSRGDLMADRRFSSVFAVDGRAATTRESGVATATALAAPSWGVAVWQMSGMDMGVATDLGSFGSFVAVWVSMMAAMMLPGAAPAVLRRVRAGGGVPAVPMFVGSYLAVWALVGVGAYLLYRPHGSAAAGAVVIAAGVYEFTPLKHRFRRRCREGDLSGFGFGRCCVGSSIGLMLMLVALGVMSVTWMAMIAVVVLAQKLLPARAAIDVPLALAVVGLGVLILIAPSSVPGLTPSM